MTVEPWAGGNPFNDDDDSEGYKPWRANKGGAVRDLVFHPAPGSGKPMRGESYLQVISWELSEDETTLYLLFLTSGQICCIKGRSLGQLIELISAKRVSSVHVWHPEAGDVPEAVITDLTFDRSIAFQPQS